MLTAAWDSNWRCRMVRLANQRKRVVCLVGWRCFFSTTLQKSWINKWRANYGHVVWLMRFGADGDVSATITVTTCFNWATFSVNILHATRSPVGWKFQSMAPAEMNYASINYKIVLKTSVLGAFDTKKPSKDREYERLLAAGSQRELQLICHNYLHFVFQYRMIFLLAKPFAFAVHSANQQAKK